MCNNKMFSPVNGLNMNIVILWFALAVIKTYTLLLINICQISSEVLQNKIS